MNTLFLDGFFTFSGEMGALSTERSGTIRTSDRRQDSNVSMTRTGFYSHLICWLLGDIFFLDQITTFYCRSPQQRVTQTMIFVIIFIYRRYSGGRRMEQERQIESRC